MQLSWIDPEELGRLAAELQAPAPPPTDSEQGFLPGLTFLEPDGTVTLIPPFAAVEAPPSSGDGTSSEQGVAPEILHIREQLRLIRNRAQQAGLISGEHAIADPAPDEKALPSPLLAQAESETEMRDQPHSSATFLPLDGTMAERLESFSKWVSRLVTINELLLIDDQGGLLWSTSAPSDLIMSALLAVTSSLRSNALGICEPPEIIRSRLNQERELSVLPCLTHQGLVSLAIVNSAGIPQDTVDWLREGLILTVDGRIEETPSN